MYDPEIRQLLKQQVIPKFLKSSADTDLGFVVDEMGSSTYGSLDCRIDVAIVGPPVKLTAFEIKGSADTTKPTQRKTIKGYEGYDYIQKRRIKVETRTVTTESRFTRQSQQFSKTYDRCYLVCDPKHSANCPDYWGLIEACDGKIKLVRRARKNPAFDPADKYKLFWAQEWQYLVNRFWPNPANRRNTGYLPDFERDTGVYGPDFKRLAAEYLFHSLRRRKLYGEYHSYLESLKHPELEARRQAYLAVRQKRPGAGQTSLLLT